MKSKLEHTRTIPTSVRVILRSSRGVRARRYRDDAQRIKCPCVTVYVQRNAQVTVGIDFNYFAGFPQSLRYKYKSDII